MLWNPNINVRQECTAQGDDYGALRNVIVIFNRIFLLQEGDKRGAAGGITAADTVHGAFRGRERAAGKFARNTKEEERRI